MKKDGLGYYLKLFAIDLIVNSHAITKEDRVREVHGMSNKSIVGRLPSGILEYLKKIDY